MEQPFETLDLGMVDGFNIKLNALPEHIDIADDFADAVEPENQEKLIQEIRNKVDRYEYIWFLAEVTASKAGVVLASEYLGCCLYDSLEDFRRDTQCEQMIKEAVEKAKEKIQELVS